MYSESLRHLSYHAIVPYATDPDHLGELIPGEPGYRALQLRRWLYEKPVLHMDSMTDLPASIRSSLAGQLWPFSVETEQTGDQGMTVKWLFRASDGIALEAVLMGYPDRVTLCISSQAGCALACTFCATGQFGFDRHLTAGEIVAQVAWAQAYLREVGLASGSDRLSNVVFMGMGEPLANYPRVSEALRRMIEYMGLSARSITVSTVGVVPGMRKLADDPWPVTLAVSLHAADDELRSRLIPLNKRYPIAEIEAAAAHYFEVKGRRVSLEWTMIDGVNDTLQQAESLAPIAKRLRAHVNLIAMNPTPLTRDSPSSRAHIHDFANRLGELGVNATIRDTRGRGIDAACGQLRARSNDQGLHKIAKFV